MGYSRKMKYLDRQSWAALVRNKRENWFKARVNTKQCLVAGKMEVYFVSKQQNSICESFQMENFTFELRTKLFHFLDARISWVDFYEN